MQLSPDNPAIARLLKALETPEETGAGAADLLVLIGMMGGMNGKDIGFAKNKTLILFTSDRRAEADTLYASDPKRFALIHQTPVGATLEKLRTFHHLPGQLAYLAWHICAADLIIRNKPKKVLIVGNPQNEFSTLWNFELPLLRQLVKTCQFFCLDQGRVRKMTKAELDDLPRPTHLQIYLESNGTAGAFAERWPKSGFQGHFSDDPTLQDRILGMLRRRLSGLALA